MKTITPYYSLRLSLIITCALSIGSFNHSFAADEKVPDDTSLNVPQADKNQSSSSSTPKAALTVNVVTPRKESWGLRIEASGAIGAWQEAIIASEISGLRITDVMVDVGDTVQEGQPLAKLSQDSVKADIAQQEAAIAQAEAAVVQAETSIQQAEAGVSQAEAGVNQAKAGVEQVRATVAQTEAGVLQAEAGVLQSQAGVNQANANLAQSQATISQVTAQVNQAAAGVNQALATLGDAQTNAERARRLRATGAIAQQEADQYATNSATARAALEAQKAGLTAQKAALEAQKAAFNALKSGVSAKRAEVQAQQAAVEAQRAVVAAKQSEIKSQLAAVDAQDAGVEAQQAAVNVQRAALNAQKAAKAVQEAAMLNQQIRLKHTTILAPDEGTITTRTAALGNVVQIGSELFRLIRGNKLEWHAEVTGLELGKIREGQTATITLPTSEVIEGQVRMVSPTLNVNTRNATVFITLPKGSGAKAGMFATGAILSGTTEAITLPQSAVILRDGFRYVFSVGSNNRVKQHKVRIGRFLDGKVEILEGVNLSDDIVTTGGAFLNDGDVINRAAPADATPADNTETPAP
ncbi:efflux RND transporter periplasmic adaptor subunit [Thiofilum flexile]|uniref:efflux RND transporter periplasmic adaptor subunit n=1 Tax=Thiofilum flexile TaxID=125627 RepID=UPI0003658E48|nr:efflux RND transporter periplasmic adaptor subunit [Thiofilum flexile]